MKPYKQHKERMVMLGLLRS